MSIFSAQLVAAAEAIAELASLQQQGDLQIIEVGYKIMETIADYCKVLKIFVNICRNSICAPVGTICKVAKWQSRSEAKRL